MIATGTPSRQHGQHRTSSNAHGVTPNQDGIATQLDVVFRPSHCNEASGMGANTTPGSRLCAACFRGHDDNVLKDAAKAASLLGSWQAMMPAQRC